MKASVIIPAYHSAATIGAALDSVAAQQYDALEILVVDDCSGDRTAAVTRDWDARRNPARIPLQLLHTPRNGGPAAARNLGIQNARGEWIAFLDADDEWLPGKLATQFAQIEKFSAENHAATPVLVCGATESWTGERAGESKPAGQNGSNPNHLEAPDRRTGPTSPTRPTIQPAPRVRLLSLEDFTAGNPVATSTVLVRREILEAAGGFDEQFRGPEDYDLWMRLAADRRPKAADLWSAATTSDSEAAPLSQKTEVQGKGRAVLLKLEVPLARYRAAPGSLSLDERRFLPEVLRVLDKAYGPGGAFHGMPDRRATSESTQYWSASWMAFQRGDRRAALACWYHAWRLNRKTSHPVDRRWYPLLLRYVGGKR